MGGNITISPGLNVVPGEYNISSIVLRLFLFDGGTEAETTVSVAIVFNKCYYL